MPTHRTPKKGKGAKTVPLEETASIVQEDVSLNETSQEVQTEHFELSSPAVSSIENVVNIDQQSRILFNFSQEIEKKFESMQKEFQHQMLEMQKMFASQNKKVSSSSVENSNENNYEPLINNPIFQNREQLVADLEQPAVVYSKTKNIYPLPEFNGTPEEWAVFIEDFQSTTREFGYSNLQNMLRLRESLKGHARETVEALLYNSANVQDIIEILRETFGRPEQLIRSQVQKVRYILPIPENDLSGLIDFANKVINMSTFFKSINANNYISNPSLISELVSKLPSSRQIQWAEKCLSLQSPPTVLDFSSWINSVRKVANIVTDTLPIENFEKIKACVKVRNIHQTNMNSSKCIVCQGDCKQLEDCTIFLNLSIACRIDQIKTLKLCFCCLKKGHQVAKCFSKKTCITCGKKHHHLIHEDSSNNSFSNSLQSYHLETYCDNVLFQVVPINLYANNNKITTYAFIDDGANATIVDKELVRSLGIEGSRDFIELKWLNQHTSKYECEVVQLQISGVQDDAKKYNMSNVYSMDNLSLPRQSLQSCDIVNKNSPLRKLPIHFYENVQPNIIISLAHAYLTTPLEAPISSQKPGPIAINTRLGWIVYGTKDVNVKSSQKYAMMVNKIKQDEYAMENMMREYFDIETFGTKIEVKPLMSIEDERSLKIMNTTIKKKGKRFECGLLWKENFVSFPNSFPLAYKRLLTVEKKMERDPEYAIKYCEKIEDYIKKGYARKLTAEEAKISTPKTFYLPHFGVINPNKPGIRLVFDAAAKVNNISFNDALLSGPDINNPLVSVLLKFRQASYAVIGDIKEMFHQIYATAADQESQRFLWRNGEKSKPVGTYVMQRIIFGATCSPTIAQFVKNFNAERFKDSSPRAVEAIVNRHYVDDYVDCFDSESEALKVIQDVINIHGDGGFELKKVVSNSENIMQSYSDDDTNVAVNVEGNESRILGMYWLCKSDLLTFKLKLNKVKPEILSFEKIPTKRELLCLIMSIFDPFGFLCDFMITAKLLMQKVWKSGINWDEELPEQLNKIWKSWLGELQKIECFKIDRCYMNKFEYALVDLHVFVDASEDALSAVAYFRVKIDNTIKVAFAMGKTSCAPTRYHTIPKLELQAAVMGVRLKNILEKHHTIKISKVVFWSDSNSVILWIRSDHRKYKQYVANRVSEILESSSVQQWRWLSGKYNPADEATRAKIPPRYNPNGRWKFGPEFLLQDEQYWPKESSINDSQNKCSDELRSKYINMTVTYVSPVHPNIERFSQWRKYKRTMAWIFRYFSNIRRKIHCDELLKGELSYDEENKAEMFLIQLSQVEMFKCDYVDLKNGKPVSKASPLKSFNPYLDNGIIRVSGRIENAEFLPISVRRPIILSKDHSLSRLIVEYFHRKFHHINSATVITEIRQKFWIISLRVLLKSVENKCQFCKNRKVVPTPPQMGVLPADRLTPFVRPFTYSGVDLFGPYIIVIRRKQEKRWVALFTCLSIRAIHLEIVSNSSTDAFLIALRNFINRRGVPKQIRSDNGKNFIGIKKEIKDELGFIDHDIITCNLAPLGIKWIFNTPFNPSEGGAWERLIQSVKKVLSLTMKEKILQVETFQGLLIEAENIVNSRPLTHIPITIADSEPLTPNHFLLGCTNSTQTPSEYDIKKLCVRKQWRILKTLKDFWWKRWIQEYLPDLTRRTKWCFPSNPPNIGSVVYICDSNIARSKWKIGRITRLYYGVDGIARSADVTSSHNILKRPLSKLAILDTE